MRGTADRRILGWEPPLTKGPGGERRADLAPETKLEPPPPRAIRRRGISKSVAADDSSTWLLVATSRAAVVLV